MKRVRRTSLAIALIVAFALPVFGSASDDDAPIPLTVEIGHRHYPDFRETLKTTMQKREQIGDTDYSFEAVEFYPHFAIVERDSTREIVSLSDEPRNVAFKIRVFEKDEVVEDTWAFYDTKVPHFSRTSFLTFRVISFEYQGKVYGESEESTK